MVLGARGGCGASMVASSLAWAIANVQQQQSVLVDLDLHFGSAALTFGLEPGPGLGAMLAAPERLDETLVAAALQTAGERLSLIATATPLAEEMHVAADAVAALLAPCCASDADWVVADLPHGLDAMARRLLRTADRVVLVAPPTLAGLRDAGRLATYITDLRAGGAPLLVVNGGNENADGMKQHLFEENLGEAVAAWVPTLPGPAAAAEAHGLPLAAVAGGRARRQPLCDAGDAGHRHARGDAMPCAGRAGGHGGAERSAPARRTRRLALAEARFAAHRASTRRSMAAGRAASWRRRWRRRWPRRWRPSG